MLKYPLTDLFTTLQSGEGLGSTHMLPQGARKELQLFESKLKEAFVIHEDPSLPLNLLIFPTKLSPTDIIAWEDKLLEWIYLYHKGH